MVESHLEATWRVGVILLGMLILCSCRSMSPVPPDNDGLISATVSSDVADLPPTAATANGFPPQCQTWRPPGIAGPWPQDEYICDGGDRDRPVKIGADWIVKGLHMEDTIAHYDTLEGETMVASSNRVCVYAPRFGSVRLVLGVDSFEGKDSLIQHNIPVKIAVEEERLLANTTLQQLQTIRAIGAKRPSTQQGNSPGLLLANEVGIIEAEGGFKPFENFRILRDGQYELTESLKLSEQTEAATVWTLDKGVQVVIDGTPAEVATGDARAQATFSVDHESNPGLRIVKVASACAAKPGEIVEFTLRFDNVGNEPLGNVTIMDNLTTRLEYVEESQTASLQSKFITQVNQGDSLILRWEVLDPIAAGDGGTVRFKCRVR